MTHPALEFLHLLDPSPKAQFNIEAYTDKKEKPKPDPLHHRFPTLSRDEVEQLLPRLNGINVEGAAIYVAVNEFSGQRKIENLHRVRGVHADLDKATEDQLRKLREMLPPTIVVQSSVAEKQHWYWLLDEGETLDADTAKAINQGIVDLGADPAAVDVTRLLRLPGFRHMKKALILGGELPFERCATVDLIDKGRTFTANEVLSAFSPVLKKMSQKRQQTSLVPDLEDTPRQRARLIAALSYISADCDYQCYRDVVWALLSLGWGDATELAQEWCNTAPHRYEEPNFWSVVNSHDPTRTPRMGTLIYLARKGGWNG
jgi:hypothetical protein